MESPGRKSTKSLKMSSKSKKLAPLEEVPNTTLSSSMSSTKSITVSLCQIPV